MLDNPTALRGIEVEQDLAGDKPEQESVLNITNTEPFKTEGLDEKRTRLDDLTAKQRVIGEQIAAKAGGIDGLGNESNTSAPEDGGDTVEDIQAMIDQIKELRKEQELTKEQVVAMEAEENALLDKKTTVENFRSQTVAKVKSELFSTAGKLGNLTKKINKIDKSLGMYSYDERFNGALVELQNQRVEFRAQLTERQGEYKQTKEGEHPVDKTVNGYIETIEENLKALHEGRAVENVEALLASLRIDAEGDPDRASQVETMGEVIEAENATQSSRQAGERTSWLRERFGKLVDNLSNVTATTKRKAVAAMLGATVLVGGFAGISGLLKSPDRPQDVENDKKETKAAQTQQIGAAEASALPGGAVIGEKNWRIKTPELPDETTNPKLEIGDDLKTPEMPDVPDVGIGTNPPEGGDQTPEIGAQDQVIDRNMGEWLLMAKSAGYNNEGEVRDLLTNPDTASDFQNIYSTFSTDKGITDEAAQAALRVFLANRVSNSGAGSGNELQNPDRPFDRPEENGEPTVKEPSEKQDVFYEKPGGHDKDWWQQRADQLGKAAQFNILWSDKVFRSNLESSSYTNHDTAEKARKAGQENVTFMGDSNNRNMIDPDSAALLQTLEQLMHERNLSIRR